MTGYIGLPPFGYAKPLEVAQNLADVPNKAAALATLGGASADDVVKSANPIGTIIAYWGSSAPAGYLPCAGQTVSSTIYPQLVTFLGGTTSATLPDLRGEFLRGWDNGRGVDTGRTLGSAQSWLIGSHTHGLPVDRGGSEALAFQMATSSSGNDLSAGAESSAFGGVETRPRNISVLYCIKAYAAPVSAGTVNLNQLISMSSTALQPADFLAAFTGTNQQLASIGWQKLPGGIIMQWGSYTAAATDSRTVTLPLTYPTLITSVYHTHSMSSNGYTPRALVTSNSQVFLGTDVFNAGSNPTGIHYWLTIGY